MSIMRFVENKETGYSEEPSKMIVEMVFNARGVCLMCGHTQERAVQHGACCPCGDCICCTKQGIVRPEES